MHLINFGFICFIAICTFIKCRGGKFNDWLNTKFKKQNVNVKIDMEIKTDAVSPFGPYLYWIDDDGEWLGTTPYKENITEEEAEQIKTELRKKRKLAK